MTTRKTFKTRVRARMAKTGERYAAALRQLDAPPDPDTTTQEHAAETETPEQAIRTAPPLVTDDAIRGATGIGWEDWFEILDAAGAAQMSHPQIARWLASERGIPGWWAQNVTVTYERARGRRAANQTNDGFHVSVSKTVGVPVERLYATLADDAERAAWLPNGVTLRRATAPKGVRLAWDDGSRVVVGLSAKGPARSQLTLSHERLADAASVERMRAEWRERLAELKNRLEAEAAAGS
jgi:hypothetical protein